ncbi:MAG: hypothetical protein ACRD5H_00765 [Nitrososphaerales archaeon]
MAEIIVVNMSEVQERNPLAKGVYTFTFKDSKAFLVRSKKEGSDWIGLQGTLIPEGHPEDGIVTWLAANYSMSNGLDAKKFLKGVGFPVDGPNAVKLDGVLATQEQLKAGQGPQAHLVLDGKPPIPVGFLKFRGETTIEIDKQGRSRARLHAVLGRVD